VSAIKGTYKNGQIVLDEVADWPEGSRVVVERVGEEGTIGIPEEAWTDSPEAIAEWLGWYDSLEPLILTPEEETEWQAARQAQKEFEIARFEERAKRNEDLFP
jgi:hypothetical protein